MLNLSRAAWQRTWRDARCLGRQAEATGQFWRLTPLQMMVWRRCQPYIEIHETPAQKLAFPF